MLSFLAVAILAHILTDVATVAFTLVTFAAKHMILHCDSLAYLDYVKYIIMLNIWLFVYETTSSYVY